MMAGPLAYLRSLTEYGRLRRIALFGGGTVQQEVDHQQQAVTVHAAAVKAFKLQSLADLQVLATPP